MTDKPEVGKIEVSYVSSWVVAQSVFELEIKILDILARLDRIERLLDIERKIYSVAKVVQRTSKEQIKSFEGRSTAKKEKK